MGEGWKFIGETRNVLSCRINQGCIFNLKFIFMDPPPPTFWFIFLPHLKCITTSTPSRHRRKMFSIFFCAILYILSQLGKKYTFFLPIGEKICIIPHFFIPFQYFFPPNLLFGHICPPPPGVGGSNRKICTPVTICTLYIN